MLFWKGFVEILLFMLKGVSLYWSGIRDGIIDIYFEFTDMQCDDQKFSTRICSLWFFCGCNEQTFVCDILKIDWSEEVNHF